jgi:hypothetical protein
MNYNLKDIKEIAQVNDYSFYIFVVVLTIAIILGLYLFRFVYKKVLRGCKIDCKKYYLYKLHSVDLSNPKKAAYEITYYGRKLATDKRTKELFFQLKIRLDRYKYKKNINKLDRDTINYYNLYKQVCDESI